MPYSPPPFEQQFGVPRCRRCYYVLENLPEPRCPECGTPFDFNDPDTYTLKPPLVRWKLWLPGLALALGGGLALYAFCVPFMGFGWSATLVIPTAAGAILGYCCRVRYFFMFVPAVFLLGGLILGLLSANFVGLLCGLMLGGIAVGPIAIGVAAGALLRVRLKHSTFDQRYHLPLIAFLLLPVLASVVERVAWRRPPLSTVQTTVVINAPLDQAWDAIRFYEEVRHGPPPLFRLGMPRPLYSTGRASSPGDQKTCVYDKGRLTKRITEVNPRQRLAFVVVEQGFERHAMTLHSGSFEFAPDEADPTHTRVTLTTTYRSHLAPQWCWRPLEKWTVHTLHRHILRGMKEEAEAQSPSPLPAVSAAERSSGERVALDGLGLK